jgi:hypothetical protein
MTSQNHAYVVTAFAKAAIVVRWCDRFTRLFRRASRSR